MHGRQQEAPAVSPVAVGAAQKARAKATAAEIRMTILEAFEARLAQATSLEEGRAMLAAEIGAQRKIAKGER